MLFYFDLKHGLLMVVKALDPNWPATPVSTQQDLSVDIFSTM